MAKKMIKVLPRASRKLVKRIMRKGYELVAVASESIATDGRARAWLVNEENIPMQLIVMSEQFKDVLLLEAPSDIPLQYGDVIYPRYDDATLEYVIKKYYDAVKEVLYEKK